jgi:hypothetical protein
MGLEYTRIVSRQYMSAIGKVVKRYRISLRMIMSNNKMGKWMLMRIMVKDMSIYDIII